jgi:mannose-6-phosphate isomerase
MLRFVPEYKVVPWGGRRLEQEFGRELPDGRIGESWELVGFGDHHSVVAEGPRAGQKLSELWSSGVLGGSARGEFPFLLKWIDTQQRMSVQVHPDDVACQTHGFGRSKSEAWYFAHCSIGAQLFLGHYAGLDEATLNTAAKGGTIAKWIYEMQPREGDMLLVPAGSLHCVGAGFLLLEVQEPSDTTFRVYDWGRLGVDDQPRELHIEQACKSVLFDRAGAHKTVRDKVSGPTFHMSKLDAGQTVADDGLRVLAAVDGAAGLSGDSLDTTLEFGDIAVLEPEDGPVRIASGTCILVTEP